MIQNPVSSLDKVLPHDLPQDWESLDDPEQVLLGVPKGTIERLLRETARRELWPELFSVASSRGDQWMLDLTQFFPHEELFIHPLTRFLSLAKTEHGQVCLAQDAAEWPWGPGTSHLILGVRAQVEAIARGVTGPWAQCASNLMSVAAQLERMHAR